MNSGKIVIGTLAGFALGALVGVLFAPEKGSVTRKNILDKGEDIANDLKDKFQEYSDLVSEKYQDIVSDTEQLANRGKSKYNDMKSNEKSILA